MVTPGEPHKPLPHAGEEALARLDRLRHANGRHAAPPQLRADDAAHHAERLRGVPHQQDASTRAAPSMDKVFAGKADIRVKDRSLIWNSDLVETLEFENLIVPGAGARSARPPTARKAAARMRARTIPSATTRNWMKHTVVWVDENGKTRIDYRPVNLQPMTNDVQSFPPKARVY